MATKMNRFIFPKSAVPKLRDGFGGEGRLKGGAPTRPHPLFEILEIACH
jgi:hypothetical protein